MSRDKFVPCLWMDDQAQAAAGAYAKIFPGGKVLLESHYPESFDNPGGKPRGSVLTVDFEIAGQRFTALNGGPMFQINQTISFLVQVATAAEVDALHEQLVDGGQELMPIDKYPWSDRYAWVKDRFGVTWQLMTRAMPKAEPMIVPVFMFAGKVHGRAEEALRTWAKVLGGKVGDLAYYGPGEGKEGTIKHGRVVIGDHQLAAMDSHIDHNVVFDEGVSLQIMCDDQAELDRLWSALSDGGEQSQCGWLKDKFGVSWQVVPRQIVKWMASKDQAANDRAFKAMLEMGKLDIAKLEAAFRHA